MPRLKPEDVAKAVIFAITASPDVLVSDSSTNAMKGIENESYECECEQFQWISIDSLRVPHKYCMRCTQVEARRDPCTLDASSRIRAHRQRIASCGRGHVQSTHRACYVHCLGVR